MKISIGSDHAGFECKEYLVEKLKEQGHEVIDHGCYANASVDYPDFVHPVGADIDHNRIELGVVICGSGNGAAITANKHVGVRCALCWNVELAELARKHNNANIISIPARYVSLTLAWDMLDHFLTCAFEGGRHAARVEKINQI